MYFKDGNWTYSPSDLTTFMESPFAAWMNQYVILNPEFEAHRDDNDALASALQQKGLIHEAEVLKNLFAEKQVIDISHTPYPEGGKLAAQAAATIKAMQDGIEVIYQGYLTHECFKGYADFLVKVEGASSLGDYHYEVWDSKLASSVKPYFVVQLCCYAQMLEAIQQRLPQYLTVVLGNREIAKLKTQDYFYYYLALKNNFLQAKLEFNPEQQPDPFDSRAYGRWSGFANDQLIKKDHLSQIANISRSQIKKLLHAGIETCAELIRHEQRVKKLSPAILDRLKKQALLQQQSKGQQPPIVELLSHPEDSYVGLCMLPPNSPNDIFFDIEGYPLIEGGLEYLWGTTYLDEQGQRQFKDFWAHNAEQEKQAFCQFIDWAYQRWQADPSMHIYHYASYEITACRKLMGRYGCYEHEVDQLLRHQVFVDLYKVVKSAMMVGTPSYSIKEIEKLYRGKRDTDVGNGGDSIVVYEQWRELWLAGKASSLWHEDATLQSIRDYNKDDCDSTHELTHWLRHMQQDNNIPFKGSLPDQQAAQTKEKTARDKLVTQLLARAEATPESEDQLKRLYQHLAWTLDFHQRENKPMWWRLFDRMGTPTDELLDDSDCLANCIRTEREPFKATPRAKNLSYEYQFPVEQEWKAGFKHYYLAGEPEIEGKSPKVELDEAASEFNDGLVIVRSKEAPPRIIHLVPDEFINASPIPEMIEQVVTEFVQDGQVKNAIFDFLRRDYPRVCDWPHGTPLITTEDSDSRLRQVIQAVANLDNSYFTIQGPPGTGKTYTAKKIIAHLLRQKKRIGIASNSHKAINNLLFSVAEYCQQENIAADFFCTKATDQPLMDSLSITFIKNNQIFESLPEQACVVGTTAWGFARQDCMDTFDYLFIDEAGQVSVANLIAMSASSRNLVILGDQMQLGQPTQGSHPEQSGLSVLDYLLGDTAAIAPEMGCFLNMTYRMHSQVNHYVSEAIYEGKLRCHTDNDRQAVVLHAEKLAHWPDYPTHCSGLIFLPVVHEDNTFASEEEVEEIARLVKLLLDAEYTCRAGKQRRVTLDDMLFVAPYNYQVKLLRNRLGSQSKVGSVDKFQGQEAPIVFFSLCSSNAEDSPRGIDFLYNKNRLNVAVSRAQALAIVVGNPALCCPSINSIEQMQKVNLVARLAHGDNAAFLTTSKHNEINVVEASGNY